MLCHVQHRHRIKEMTLAQHSTAGCKEHSKLQVIGTSNRFKTIRCYDKAEKIDAWEAEPSKLIEKRNLNELQYIMSIFDK